MSVTVNYGATSLVCPAGTCLDIKLALSGHTKLAVEEMKLLAKGKVVSGDDTAVVPNTKLMLTRVPAAAPSVRLRVREIVSGRVPRTPVCVSPSTPHDELVSTVVRALRLPPCDEFTEVRLCSLNPRFWVFSQLTHYWSFPLLELSQTHAGRVVSRDES